MVQKNFFIRVIMMLCLFWAGASRAWAYDFEIKGVQYSTWTSLSGNNAVVTGYTGTAETLTIPAYVTNGSTTYKVGSIKNNSGNAPVDISSVKKLIFEGYVYLSGSSSNPTFTCPALTDIVFKGASPTLSGSYSAYFGTRTGITAHVTDKTDEEIETLKNSTTVWSDFYDIVPYNEAVSETLNVYLTVEHAWVKVDDTSIFTQGTETRSFQKNKHGNFTFEANNKYFTYDLYEVYVNGKNIKDEMTQSDSWNQYTIPTNKQVYLHNYSGDANDVVKLIEKKYYDVDFQVFEMTQLNQFMNHLIAHNTIFVAVENELVDYVFDTLNKEYPGRVMLKPSLEMYYRYLQDNEIVVGRLPSETPKGIDKPWQARIEKILVDVLVDKLIGGIVPEGEKPAIVEGAYHDFLIDEGTLLRYAKRKGAVKKVVNALNEYGRTVAV